MPRTPTAKSKPLDGAVIPVPEEINFDLQLPDPEDSKISEAEFQQQINLAWQVCDRIDLQTDVWRGKILRTVRDREKQLGEDRGMGFLNWLKDREISKSHAYNLIELANSADEMLSEGYLEETDVNQFTKRAFVETAQAAPEVRQMIADTAKQGNKVTRREVRQLSDEWTAMTSDLLPETVREKAANQTIPARYLAPLVKQMEKLPEVHQVSLRDTVEECPDVDTLKQVTAEARYLARYLESATQVQVLANSNLDLETALEEALRLGCLNSTADLVNQAAQMEQLVTKLHATWRRINQLTDRLYVDTGASTPHLRSMLSSLERLSGESIDVTIGDPTGEGWSREIRVKIEDDREDEAPVETGDWE
ncbi:hypothetical protein IQ266_25620 [filamentous cyanobacterium LEGE 11480]|uniref:Uncharacterized protein n=1 Tax=Romeriopsis navalis LEGE 11480 TaxID=2777977 RepID=A0A928Z4Z0_9CYAN|nr:hypothetical protein [Romeriopsis navalis]MBE9033121.1 hypothetical protein [Romeriopsis navalis LEGE 11480]